MPAFPAQRQYAANDFRPQPPRAAIRDERIVTLAVPAPPRRTTLMASIMACVLMLGISGAALWFVYNPETILGAVPVPGMPVRLQPKNFIAANPDINPAPKVAAADIPPTPVESLRPADDAAAITLSADKLLPPEQIRHMMQQDSLTLNAISKNISDAPALSITPAAMPTAYKPLDEAQTLLENGDDQAALALYYRILDKDQKNRGALKGKVAALQHLGRTDDAVKTGRGLVQLAPDDEAARISLVAALGQSYMPSALTELRHIVELNPGNAVAHAELARQLARHGYLEEAFSHLNRAIALAPQKIAYRLDLAIIYDQAGYMADALTAYRQVLHAASEMDEPSQLPFSVPSIRERAEYLAAKIAAPDFSAAPR